MDRMDIELYYEFMRAGYKSNHTKRRYREQLRREAYKPPVSLMKAPRCHYDEDGEGYTEYGIYDMEECTDEEIEQQLSEEWEEWQIRSPYDCTGKIFMCGYHWKRLQNGCISIVQRFARDV